MNFIQYIYYIKNEVPSQHLFSTYLKIVLDFLPLFCYNIRMNKTQSSRWSDKDIRLLSQWYGDISIDEMSTMVGKSHSAIRAKVHYLRKRGWAFDSTRR
jgi:hypothetical protein